MSLVNNVGRAVPCGLEYSVWPVKCGCMAARHRRSRHAGGHERFIGVLGDEPGLRLEVRMKPEARAAYKEMPLDHAPFDLSLLPGDADGYIITSGARTGQRGFFTRDENGAVGGAEFAGRLYSRVPTAPKVKPGVRSRTGQEPK